MSSHCSRMKKTDKGHVQVVLYITSFDCMLIIFKCIACLFLWAVKRNGIILKHKSIEASPLTFLEANDLKSRHEQAAAGCLIFLSPILLLCLHEDFHPGSLCISDAISFLL